MSPQIAGVNLHRDVLIVRPFHHAMEQIIAQRPSIPRVHAAAVLLHSLGLPRTAAQSIEGQLRLMPRGVCDSKLAPIGHADLECLQPARAPEPHDARVDCLHEPVETEDSERIAGRQVFWRGDYADHVAFDPGRARREWQARRGLIETNWGYAVTVHKSEGSQWENVVIFDDGYGRSAGDRRRWLYTSITRAEKGLVILS